MNLIQLRLRYTIEFEVYALQAIASLILSKKDLPQRRLWYSLYLDIFDWSLAEGYQYPFFDLT